MHAGSWRIARQRPYLVIWVAEDEGALSYALEIVPTGRPDSVVVTFAGVPQRRAGSLGRLDAIQAEWGITAQESADL